MKKPRFAVPPGWDDVKVLDVAVLVDSDGRVVAELEEQDLVGLLFRDDSHTPPVTVVVPVKRAHLDHPALAEDATIMANEGRRVELAHRSP